MMRHQSTIPVSALLCLIPLVLSACSGGGCSGKTGSDSSVSAPGPLRVDAANPRYFTDGSGKAIYLTGSHTWNNFKDKGTTDPPPEFDYNSYLNFLSQYNHNFIRLWAWELTKYKEKEEFIYFESFPWQRSGPGLALDGKPKFDLIRLDQTYFDRLRSKIIAARDRGIYVSIMFFEGWAIFFAEKPWCWDGHPFNVHNNINGIDGDPDRDGRGLESHTLQIPNIVKIEKEYIKKVIDTVNDLDNVLYEISNEDHADSVAWQYHLIDFIHNYEKTKPKQHPVGMTTQVRVGNEVVFSSNADWISPSITSWPGENDAYKIDPPQTDGKKVIILDTDHIWGRGGDRAWVWKSFLRGYNVIFMDNLTNENWNQWNPDDARKAMGHALTYANKINLRDMLPRKDLSSTTYCLASPGSEYLIYQPASDSFTVKLIAGTYDYEWFHPETGKVNFTGSVISDGGNESFKAPFEGDAVLYIYKHT